MNKKQVKKKIVDMTDEELEELKTKLKHVMGGYSWLASQKKPSVKKAINQHQKDLLKIKDLKKDLEYLQEDRDKCVVYVPANSELGIPNFWTNIPWLHQAYLAMQVQLQMETIRDKSGRFYKIRELIRTNKYQYEED